MKQLTIFAVLMAIFSAGISLGGEGKVVDEDRLVERDGLMYEVDSETPFTGKAAEYWPDGQKQAEGEFRDGKVQKLTLWYKNGQKDTEREYRDGMLLSEKCWDEAGSPKPCEEFLGLF